MIGRQTAVRDKGFSRKRLSELYLQLGAGWSVLCVLGVNGKNAAEIQIRDSMSCFINNYAPWLRFGSVSLFITLYISPPGPCWMFLTSAITSQSHMRSAREGEGKSMHKDSFIPFYILMATSSHLPFCNHWAQLFPHHNPVIASASFLTVSLFLVQDSTLSPTLLACLMATCGRCTWSTEERWRTAAYTLVCCSLDALSSFVISVHICQISIFLIFDTIYLANSV